MSSWNQVLLGLTLISSTMLAANHNAQGKINKKSDGNLKLRLRLYLFGLLPLFLLFSLLYFTFLQTHSYLSLFSEMTLGRKKHVADRLDYYYKVINTTILSKQDAGSGLIPASVAITVSVSLVIMGDSPVNMTLILASFVYPISAL
jgi:hypothetical protein